MEFLAGGDLSDRIRSGPLPVSTAVGFACDIGAALNAAHGFEYRDQGRVVRGVVHRDVKPQNICFDERGRLVVVDFGLARVLEDPSSTGGLAGTPQYMAPEQWRPDLTVDHRVDVYALGAVLYEMLTGAPPFTGGSLEEIRDAHLTAPPPDPRAAVPGIPAYVADAVRSAMAKDPQDRPATVGEFCQALRAVAASARDAAGHRLAGDALARRDQFDAAIREYDSALRLDPLDPLARINRGYCLYRKGDLRAAIAEYDVAIRVDPMNAEARNNRGMAWLDLGDLDRAEADFRRAIELDPHHPLAPNNLRAVEARRRVR